MIKEQTDTYGKYCLSQASLYLFINSWTMINYLLHISRYKKPKYAILGNFTARRASSATVSWPHFVLNVERLIAEIKFNLKSHSTEFYTEIMYQTIVINIKKTLKLINIILLIASRIVNLLLCLITYWYSDAEITILVSI